MRMGSNPDVTSELFCCDDVECGYLDLNGPGDSAVLAGCKMSVLGQDVYGIACSEAWHDHAAHGTLSCVVFGFGRRRSLI